MPFKHLEYSIEETTTFSPSNTKKYAKSKKAQSILCFCALTGHKTMRKSYKFCTRVRFIFFMNRKIFCYENFFVRYSFHSWKDFQILFSIHNNFDTVCDKGSRGIVRKRKRKIIFLSMNRPRNEDDGLVGNFSIFLLCNFFEPLIFLPTSDFLLLPEIHLKGE